MRRYRALLIGNWHYPEDPANLPDLKGPLNDVSRLAELLGGGMFAPADVTALTERASHEITAELEHFFADADRSDVLFVYYSGHGLTADDGSLLLCGRNARTDRKLASTVSSETINRMMRGCAAAAIVIVLDCCHAGAFKSGGIAADLAGKGRFVLAASRSRDRAPDAEHATGLSRFTGHLIRGLRGEALSAGSAHITLSDLYRYVHRAMTAEGPTIPQRRFDGDGDVVLAVSSLPVPVEPAAALTVSETMLDLGEVHPGEVLPPERIYVTARAADGSAAGWTAETEADWVTLTPAADHLVIALAPRAGTTRANVHIRHSGTGESRTVRIVARLAAPAVPAPRVAAPATVEVTMPVVGETVSEATVDKWHKRPGDPVRKDDRLLDVSTDKADIEVPAPASGVLREILIPAGSTVETGTPLGVIEPRFDLVLLGMPDGAGLQLRVVAAMDEVRGRKSLLSRVFLPLPCDVLTYVDERTAIDAHARLMAVGAGVRVEVYPAGWRPPATPEPATPEPASTQVDAEATVRAILTAGHAGLQGEPTDGRAERAARKRAGVASREATLGTFELSGGAVVLFTSAAMYWTAHSGGVKAIPYSRFGQLDFQINGERTHVDLGDGAWRLAGNRAVPMRDLLRRIQQGLAR